MRIKCKKFNFKISKKNYEIFSTLTSDELSPSRNIFGIKVAQERKPKKYFGTFYGIFWYIPKSVVQPRNLRHFLDKKTAKVTKKCA